MQHVVGLLFSKDRAMQLDATIRSLYVHCQDVQNIDLKVIWAHSNARNEQQYQELVSMYPDVEFISEVDFESQVLASIASYEYVLFLVDDNLFVRDFSIGNIIESLIINLDALGFSLRLGTNTNYCYMLRSDQELPSFTNVDHEFLKFDWTSAQHDFGYPLEVSSSVFRVVDIMAVLQHSFFNPNTLEAYLNENKIAFCQQKKFLLCNAYSCTFCNPINKVQTIFNNRAGETFHYPADNLREMFTRGYRIDVEEYCGFLPNACHQEVELKFKKNVQDVTVESVKIQDALPKVSVIMPVYNAEAYLSEAIESILGQTFVDFEFIIIDDGSTDGSLNIIKTYSDPRIVVVCNETNLKLIPTLNKGLNLAKGQYIACMHADDISLPERLTRQVEFMDQNPNICVCGTWVELFGDCEQVFWRFTAPPDEVKCMLLFGCCIAHPSVMLRRTIVEAGLGYSPLYPHAEDYALWVQIAQNYEIANIPEVLLKYRRSEGQVSSKYAGQLMEIALKIQREQINALGIEPTEEECLLHWAVGASQFTPTISFANAVSEWFSKLKEGNFRYHYYPEPAFSNYLRIYWRGICNNLMDAF
ncbi:glycosyltransferase family 2 protein [Pelosinus sp. sgz500959]|uniref:glycosyltransferase family 2 protein n=1 Tax=Pelosinus sp. sgz500959 TaxID=3242472 RepID=UPI00366C35D2